MLCAEQNTQAFPKEICSSENRGAQHVGVGPAASVGGALGNTIAAVSLRFPLQRFISETQTRENLASHCSSKCETRVSGVVRAEEPPRTQPAVSPHRGPSLAPSSAVQEEQVLEIKPG